MKNSLSKDYENKVHISWKCHQCKQVYYLEISWNIVFFTGIKWNGSHVFPLTARNGCWSRDVDAGNRKGLAKKPADIRGGDTAKVGFNLMPSNYTASSADTDTDTFYLTIPIIEWFCTFAFN